MTESATDLLAGFLPDPKRAEAVLARVQRQLAGSVEAVLRAVEPKVELSADARRLGASMCEAKRVSPAFFSAYFDLLKAAVRDDLDACRDLLEELGATIDGMAPAGEPSLLAWQGLPAATRARYGRYLNADTSTYFELAAAEPEAFTRTAGDVAEAMKRLGEALPALAGELRVLISEIVLCSRAARSASLRFQGATTFYAFGAMFLNCDHYKGVVRVAEGLAHEGAHALLYGLSLGKPFVENPAGERHPSPLRADPRPLDGIFHATFVSARMHHAISRLLDAGAFTQHERADAMASMQASLRAFLDGAATLDAHARLTPLGNQLLAGAREAMDAARQAEPGHVRLLA